MELGWWDSCTVFVLYVGRRIKLYRIIFILRANYTQFLDGAPIGQAIFF
jgi:hypothetical protein